MRIVLVSFLLLISASIFAQGDTTITAARKKEIDDSITKVLKKVSDSIGAPVTPVYETVDTAKSTNPGLDYFVRMEERRTKDEKKSAILKIVLGVLLLAILIFGLMRKPKKKKIE